MGQRLNNTRLGIFVIVALALFTVAVYYIGNQQNLFGEKFLIGAVFQNINGLQKGNNVRYSGINVGNVEDIKILNDSMIQVDMMLNTEVQKFVKRNAIASIGSDGLVGNMIVNITPGRGEAPPVIHGDMIESYSRVEADDMLGTLGKTTENIELLSRNLLELSEQMLEGDGSIAQLINDKDLARNLATTFENLQVTSERFRAMGNNLNQGIEGAVQEGEGALGYLFTDSLLSQQVEGIVLSIDTLLDVRMQPLINNLEQSSVNIVSSTEKLKSIMESINLQEGMAGAVLKDEDVAKDFRLTMQNLNESTAKFNENMDALKHNFLFRRYFKKLEKQEKKNNKKVQND